MPKMRKVWITTRAGIPGQYVEWHDDENRRRSKYFSPKHARYAKIFQTRKFAELNADCRPIGAITSIPWSEAIEQYKAQKKLDGLSIGSLTDINNTISIFEKHCPILFTGDIRQRTIDDFKKTLGEMSSTHIDRETKQKLPISKNTINKHLRNIRTLLLWLQARQQVATISIKTLKTDDRIIRILDDHEIKTLVSVCDTTQWRLRVLLAVCTGMRRSAIDGILIRHIDIERKTISARDRKTKKITLLQPLPDGIMPELTKYITELPDGQEKLFSSPFNQKHWEKIKRLAGLSDITFHDLRRTFGSLQADAGTPIKAVQEMMNHSKIETTMKHYIKSGETQKRDSVNRLKVGEWI